MRTATFSRCAALAVLFLSSPAVAADGVVEINQTCAISTGCFSGDAAGFPITIDGSAGSSYRLTSDLVLPDVNTTGIVVTAPSIQIELSGFAIARDGCLQTDCTAATGAGYGIQATVRNLTVRNGLIQGVGSDGIRLANQSLVADMRIRLSGGSAIFTSSRVSVRDSTLESNQQTGVRTIFGGHVTNTVISNNGGEGINFQNGPGHVSNSIIASNGLGLSAIFCSGLDPGAGVCHILDNTITRGQVVAGPASRISGNVIDRGRIAAAEGALVTRNTIDGASGTAIAVGPGATVTGNVVTGGTGAGIVAGIGALVKENVVRDTAGNGIETGDRSTIADNTTVDNAGDGIRTGVGSTVSGNTSAGNTLDGIETDEDGLVQRNAVYSNGSIGLNLNAGTAYRENVMNDNTLAEVFGGVNMFSNSCNRTTSCP